MSRHEAPEPTAPHGNPAVWRVDKDTGQGELIDEADLRSEGENFGEVVDAIVSMASRLHDAVHAIPNIMDKGSFRIGPEKFDASTRLAFVNAGNALDYAYRLIEDKRIDAVIKKLRRELAEAMRVAGLTGDPDYQDE